MVKDPSKFPVGKEMFDATLCTFKTRGWKAQAFNKIIEDVRQNHFHNEVFEDLFLISHSLG